MKEIIKGFLFDLDAQHPLSLELRFAISGIIKSLRERAACSRKRKLACLQYAKKTSHSLKLFKIISNSILRNEVKL